MEKKDQSLRSLFHNVLAKLFVTLQQYTGRDGRSREKTLPMYFRTHVGSKVADIIQCFENKLVPGDVVQADRGFDIQDSVWAMSAKVYIPACTRWESQLSALDVKIIRIIADQR